MPGEGAFLESFLGVEQRLSSGNRPKIIRQERDRGERTLAAVSNGCFPLSYRLLLRVLNRFRDILIVGEFLKWSFKIKATHPPIIKSEVHHRIVDAALLLRTIIKVFDLSSILSLPRQKMSNGPLSLPASEGGLNLNISASCL